MTRIETLIEESIKATNQRFDALEKPLEDINISLNKRIDDLRSEIRTGFDLLTNLLVAVIGLIAVMVGVMVWFVRQDRPISKKHYDKLIKILFV